MNRKQILITIIVVVILSVLATAIVVNGIYTAGGLENYVDGILKAFGGRRVIYE